MSQENFTKLATTEAPNQVYAVHIGILRKIAYDKYVYTFGML